MTDLDELIAKLEAASEGSQELDEAIARTLAHHDYAWWRDRTGRSDFTRSLDDALTLVPEGCSADIHVGPHDIYSNATAFVPRKSLDEQGRHVTSFEPHEAPSAKSGKLTQQPAAIALCIAALRARQAVSPREGKRE